MISKRLIDKVATDCIRRCCGDDRKGCDRDNSFNGNQACCTGRWCKRCDDGHCNRSNVRVAYGERIVPSANSREVHPKKQNWGKRHYDERAHVEDVREM